MDRRLTPANGRVAAERLRGIVQAERYVAGRPARVAAPFTDICRAPGGARDRQLVLGEAVTVYEEVGGFAFVEAAKDGYVGYLRADALGDPQAATHWVAVPASHAYTAPDMKAADRHELVFGSRLKIVGAQGRFMETAEGLFVPQQHLWPVERVFADAPEAASLFLGVPYLWGGNTTRGIDCSGLVQAALNAAGHDCPGDSDLQEALGAEQPAGTALERGDLLFWKGHVAIAVDAGTLIHANAHDMAVAYEAAEAAMSRIEAQGDGPVTSHRRL